MWMLKMRPSAHNSTSASQHRCAHKEEHLSSGSEEVVRGGGTQNYHVNVRSVNASHLESTLCTTDCMIRDVLALSKHMSRLHARSSADPLVVGLNKLGEIAV
jgi:hypothetical protein